MSSRVRAAFLVLMATVVLVLAGCDGATSAGSEEPTPTPIPPPPIPEKPTYTVKRGDVVDSLSFTGRAAPINEEELYFRESGRVKQVFVQREDPVEEGTLLAELENDDLKRQLAQSEIELEAAELNLSQAEKERQYAIERAAVDRDIKELRLRKTDESKASQALDLLIAQYNLEQEKEGPSAEDIDIAQRNIERAKNSLWSAQVNRDATCGRTKEEDCDSAQASVHRAEEDVRIQELNFQKMMKGPDAEEIAILEAKIEQAKQKAQQISIDVEIQTQEVVLAQMALDKLSEELDPQKIKAVERAKLSVERLNAQLEDTVVFSPIPGKVTSVSAYEGREINAFRPVFVVADEGELEITAEPMSSQLQRLAEGMDADVILSAYPGKELPAEIIQLPYPYGRGGGANIEEADKLTHITFDPQDLDIEPGDLVKVIVTIEEKPETLWLPPAAIRTFAGRKFVVIEEEGRQRRADITTGIESADRIEIVDGVEDGQVVIGQ